MLLSYEEEDTYLLETGVTEACVVLCVCIKCVLLRICMSYEEEDTCMCMYKMYHPPHMTCMLLWHACILLLIWHACILILRCRGPGVTKACMAWRPTNPLHPRTHCILTEACILLLRPTNTLHPRTHCILTEACMAWRPLLGGPTATWEL